MNQLIAVGHADIGGQQANSVNARDLHAFLEVGKDFSTWIKDRIEQYGFLENQDFVTSAHGATVTYGEAGVDSPISGNQKAGRGGDRRSKDYHLTLDMAKELSMVERTEKGKQARQYFIECERRAIAAQGGSLTGDTEVDRLVSMRDRGLMSRDEIRRAAFALLGLPDLASEPIAPRLSVTPPRKAAPWPASPSGEPTFNVGNEYLTSAALSCWVRGGIQELMRAMREFGLIDHAGKPIGKGVALAVRFGKTWRFAARDTLKIIGAWPTR